MANVLNANDIIVGTGRMYVNGADVGQIDGEVTFTHSKTNYEKKSGFPASTVLSVLTEESASSEFNLLEANLGRIRSMMSEYAAITETPGVSDSTEETNLGAYTTRHTKLQYSDLVTLTLTSTTRTETDVSGEVVSGSGTSFTLAYEPKSVAAIYKLGSPLTEGAAADYTINMETGVITLAASANAEEITADYVTEDEVTLTLNRDFYADMLAGRFYISPSAVYTPSYVDATYTYNTYAASGFGIGGASTSSQTFLLEFVHKRRDGKYRVIKVWKGVVVGDFSVSFQEQAESPVPISVKAIADSSKPAGKQLMTVVDTTTAPYGGW